MMHGEVELNSLVTRSNRRWWDVHSLPVRPPSSTRMQAMFAFGSSMISRRRRPEPVTSRHAPASSGTAWAVPVLRPRGNGSAVQRPSHAHRDVPGGAFTAPLCQHAPAGFADGTEQVVEFGIGASSIDVLVPGGPAARGASPSAFDRRCIPPRCVAQRSNIGHILASRALRSGRIAGLWCDDRLPHGLPETPTLAASVDERETERKRRAAGKAGGWVSPAEFRTAVADAATDAGR